MMDRSILAENPDIVVSTPSRAMMHIGTAMVKGIERLVIDEADLVLSYGYDDDLQGIAKALPKGLQTFLMSATLTKEVETLKTLFCRSPAILRLEEDGDSSEGGISQFVVKFVHPTTVPAPLRTPLLTKPLDAPKTRNSSSHT